VEAEAGMAVILVGLGTKRTVGEAGEPGVESEDSESDGIQCVNGKQIERVECKS
jgi:hypothetical protein